MDLPRLPEAVPAGVLDELLPAAPGAVDADPLASLRMFQPPLVLFHSRLQDWLPPPWHSHIWIHGPLPQS
ncbi:hypothetical protein OG764_37635 [Streptomyces sp. NBC_00239]